MTQVQGRHKGFTLIELMVTISIAAVLMMIAVPDLTSFRRNAELTSVANKFINAVNAARGEAMKRGMNAMVTPLDNGASWGVGWAAFVDKTRLQSYNLSPDSAVAIQEMVPSGITVTGNSIASGATPYIMFDASGFSKAKAGNPAALAVEIKRNDVSVADQPSQTRYVIISVTGRVRVCKPAMANDPTCNMTSND